MWCKLLIKHFADPTESDLRTVRFGRSLNKTEQRVVSPTYLTMQCYICGQAKRGSKYFSHPFSTYVNIIAHLYKQLKERSKKIEEKTPKDEKEHVDN